MPAPSRSSWLARSTNGAHPLHAAPRRLLLADEDPSFLRRYASPLEEAGYQVHVALDGSSALRQATDDDPDLVVLALRLPGVDGLGVLRTLRSKAHTRDLPVLVLTNWPERRLLDEARRLGVLDCCAKNLVGPSELRVKIDALFKSGLVGSAA